jgi:SAM-dependent methyltransferase
MFRNYYATAALAAHYDADTGERPDFAFYLGLAAKLGSNRVIDIGCGTGRLASRLAVTGVEVIGLDPQPTMLALARQQPNAPAVRWLEGTADTLPADWADLVLMTGHVAQYFLDDEAWRHVLFEAHRALRSGGHLAFEIRNDAAEAWRNWATDGPARTSAGTLENEIRRDGDLVTSTGHWVQGERTWTTSETLRFPSWSAVTGGLAATGFTISRLWGDFEGSPLRADSPEWILLVHRD